LNEVGYYLTLSSTALGKEMTRILHEDDGTMMPPVAIADVMVILAITNSWGVTWWTMDGDSIAVDHS